jgi:hypothetical protein
MTGDKAVSDCAVWYMQCAGIVSVTDNSRNYKGSKISENMVIKYIHTYSEVPFHSCKKKVKESMLMGSY